MSQCKHDVTSAPPLRFVERHVPITEDTSRSVRILQMQVHCHLCLQSIWVDVPLAVEGAPQ